MTHQAHFCVSTKETENRAWKRYLHTHGGISHHIMWKKPKYLRTDEWAKEADSRPVCSLPKEGNPDSHDSWDEP